MTFNVLVALAGASIFLLVGIVALLRWLGRSLRRLTDTVAAVSEGAQKPERTTLEWYERLRKVELEIKATDDDIGQLRESFKRWQGRVSKQTARDAQEAVTNDGPETMGEFELLAAGSGGPHAPVGNVKPGRIRLLPKLRTHNRG